MALLLHYTGQDYISRGLLKTELTPGSTSAFAEGCKTGRGFVAALDSTSVLTSNTPLEHTLFSATGWFMITQDVATGQRCTIFGTANVQNKFIIDVFDNNRLRVFVVFNDNTTYSMFTPTANTIQLNTWHHFAVTVNTTTRFMTLWRNGAVVDAQTYPNKPLQVSTRFSIAGRFDVGSRPIRICNFKYYNHVLSKKEIAEDYKSLMIHYKLDKPITTQVFDHSGFNRHISVIENTTTNSTTEKRVYGGSLANNGTQSLYGSLNLSELNDINEISVAVRFRFVQQDSNHAYFVSRLTVVSNGIGLYKVGGSSRKVYVDIAGRNSFTLPYDLVSGTWYDLVAVKSPTDMKLYINGVLINTISNTNSISNIGQLYASIGRSIADTDLTNSNTMNGNVQDIRFYAKALTQKDVTELYQTRHMVDKSSNCYTYELIEGQPTVGMNKQGQLLCDEVIEGDDGVFKIVKSNKTIKTKEIKEI